MERRGAGGEGAGAAGGGGEGKGRRLELERNRASEEALGRELKAKRRRAEAAALILPSLLFLTIAITVSFFLDPASLYTCFRPWGLCKSRKFIAGCHGRHTPSRDGPARDGE